MSVIIEGMEMPKEGSWVTLRVFPDGQCFLYSWCEYDFDFMEYLTAAPVPDHGRLIDADALIKGIEADAIWKYNAINEYDRGIRSGARAVMRSVRNAPTIFPASKED